MYVLLLQKLNSTITSAFGNSSYITGIKPLESPGVTPIKPLPFSPSQFLNSPTMNLSFDSTIPASTPVRKHYQKVGIGKILKIIFKTVCPLPTSTKADDTI